MALKGDGLQYILTHSDVKYLVIDDTLYEKFSELKRPVGVIEKVFVRRTTSLPLPGNTLDLKELLDASGETPDHDQPQCQPPAVTGRTPAAKRLPVSMICVI